MKFLMANTRGFTPEMYEEYARLGLELVYLDGHEEKNYDHMDFSDIDGVVCFRFFCSNDIKRFPKLKFIHATSAGLDHMPLDYIREKGITLFNARGVFSAPIAEFTLCAVLQLYKHFPSFAKKQREHRWRMELPLTELDGKTLALIGAGSIAEETAKRFSAMGCRCIAFCRHPAPNEHFDSVESIDRLDEMLGEMDIVVSSVPLTDETYHMFDGRRFALMKPGSIFANVGRGATVDGEALAHALKNGPMMGAFVDVFETEPLPPESPLWDAENLILTPHNSFGGENNYKRMFSVVYGNTKKWLEENAEK